MIKCISKHRDKNNIIIGYTLEDTETHKRINMLPSELKTNITEGRIRISNLKLTTDNRLIDYDDTQDINIEKQRKHKLVQSYSNGHNTNKINYAMSKINSKRVGKLVTRALLIGLTCASVGSVMVGCSSTEPMEVNAVQQEETVKLSFEDKINLLNDASEIFVDIHNFSLTPKATISVDDTEIGDISGKFIKIFDTMTFKDSDDNIIAQGKQEVHIAFDGWTIFNSEGNAVFRMKEKLGLTKRYIIVDLEDNEIAWLKKDFDLFTNSAKVYDMDDNIIAEIEQNFMRKDFTIKILDSSKIDNTSMTSICTQYIMQKIQQDKKSSSSKSDNSD